VAHFPQLLELVNIRKLSRVSHLHQLRQVDVLVLQLGQPLQVLVQRLLEVVLLHAEVLLLVLQHSLLLDVGCDRSLPLQLPLDEHLLHMDLLFLYMAQLVMHIVELRLEGEVF
jgi:hypothetical protein